MSSAHSLNARKGVPAQKHYPSQACAHESSKVWVRRKREEERQKRQRLGGWMKEKQPTKQKHIWGAKTRRGGAKVNKAGRGTVNFPYPHNVTPSWVESQEIFGVNSYTCYGPGHTVMYCHDFYRGGVVLEYLVLTGLPFDQFTMVKTKFISFDKFNNHRPLSGVSHDL